MNRRGGRPLGRTSREGSMMRVLELPAQWRCGQSSVNFTKGSEALDNQLYVAQRGAGGAQLRSNEKQRKAASWLAIESMKSPRCVPYAWISQLPISRRSVVASGRRCRRRHGLEPVSAVR